jgi:hypothetical protein
MAKNVDTDADQDSLSASRAFADYKVKVFLDANVVLEGKPLAGLPWEDIDPEGPILALLTPQVLSEVDSKKRDGRLARIARSFNQLIASVALGGPPVVLREASPRVALALATCNRIDWDQYDDLDPDDGDSRVVAEILHARDLASEEKLLVSQDIKPLAFATRHGIGAFRITDTWLRSPEPSPQDKTIQRLQHRVRELEVTEPELEVEITFGTSDPVTLYRVADLSPDEREAIKRKILGKNRKPSQSRQTGAFGISSPLMDYNYDSSLDRRYATYRDTTLPAFMNAYERKIERLYNQIPFTVRIANVGHVRADKFVAAIESSEGWLHHKFVFVPPQGPPSPSPRSSLDYLQRGINPIHVPSRVGRHEVEFVEGKDRTPLIVVNCEDFRHGQEWVFNGVFALDAHQDAPASIIARVTASNLHGAVEAKATIAKHIEIVGVFDLINTETLRVERDLLMQDVLDRAIESESYRSIEFDKGDDDDD